jgi:hypothetical protein
MKSLHAAHQDGRKQPTGSDLRKTFDLLIKRTHRTFIVLDALDESQVRDEVTDLIVHLQRGHPDHLHVCATSRRERDLEEALQPSVTQDVALQTALVDQDILLLVDNRLRNDPKLKKWKSSPIGEEIRNKLAQKSHGM